MTAENSKRFLELPIATRAALTERAIAEHKTQASLWIAFETPPDWNERAALAAELLSGWPAVADLGAGYMHLERFLQPGVSYHPVDFSPRDQRTLVCDFNASPVPRTPALAAACLGLIEYICDPKAFLSKLAENYTICAITYNVVKNADDEEEIRVRRGWGWVHDFDLASFEKLLSRAWIIAQRRSCGESQFIWQLKAKRRLLPWRPIQSMLQRISRPASEQ
jgi:hypothetical protein